MAQVNSRAFWMSLSWTSRSIVSGKIIIVQKVTQDWRESETKIKSEPRCRACCEAFPQGEHHFKCRNVFGTNTKYVPDESPGCYTQWIRVTVICSLLLVVWFGLSSIILHSSQMLQSSFSDCQSCLCQKGNVLSASRLYGVRGLWRFWLWLVTFGTSTRFLQLSAGLFPAEAMGSFASVSLTGTVRIFHLVSILGYIYIFNANLMSNAFSVRERKKWHY